MPVALASLASLTKHKLVTIFCQVDNGLQIDSFLTALELDCLRYGAGITAVNYRSRRDLAYFIFRAFTMLTIASTMLAPLGNQLRIIGISLKIIHRWVNTENDRAAVAAITSVRAAFGTELLTPKVDNPIATISGFCINSDVIDKHDLRRLGDNM